MLAAVRQVLGGGRTDLVHVHCGEDLAVLPLAAWLAARRHGYRLDADGEIPVTAAVRLVPEGGVVLTLTLADVTGAEITGAAPKGASLHDLRCAADATGRWSCGITIDV